MSRAVDNRSTRAQRAGRAERLPRIANWLLDRAIGEGGWTHVYAARPAASPVDHTADYALKILKQPHRENDAARAALHREMRLGRSISHPHLVAVLASGEHNGLPYLVMPLLEGATLQTIVHQQGPLPPPDALWIARQIAEALASLHDKRWRHGDVKPANVIVSPLGHATLLDLGLAAPLSGCSSTADDRLAGTLSYCAPESFTPAVRTGAASDIYCLGVTLFEMLTGALPFPYEKAEDLATAHLRIPPPDVRKTAPQCSNRVARLLRSLLAKEPLRRPSAAELVDWLYDLEIDTLGESVPE